MTDEPTTAVGPGEESLRNHALDRIRRRRAFRAHLAAYVAGTLLVAAVWAVTEYHNAGGWPTGFRTGRRDHDWDPWVMYPLIGGTLALAVHAWLAFVRRPLTEGEIEREVERLRAE
ncbi:MAG: 2TM domain-containing protein [Gaiellales bacterium]